MSKQLEHLIDKPFLSSVLHKYRNLETNKIETGLLHGYVSRITEDGKLIIYPYELGGDLINRECQISLRTFKLLNLFDNKYYYIMFRHNPQLSYSKEACDCGYFKAQGLMAKPDAEQLCDNCSYGYYSIYKSFKTEEEYNAEVERLENIGERIS
jgi:hypothetical protein